MLSSTNENPSMKSMTHVRACDPAELNLFMPKGRFIGGVMSTTLVTSTDRYLPWAMKQFRGEFIHRKVSSWNELIGRCVQDWYLCLQLDRFFLLVVLLMWWSTAPEWVLRNSAMILRCHQFVAKLWRWKLLGSKWLFMLTMIPILFLVKVQSWIEREARATFLLEIVINRPLVSGAHCF